MEPTVIQHPRKAVVATTPVAVIQGVVVAATITAATTDIRLNLPNGGGIEIFLNTGATIIVISNA